jgi:hypothetical protein
MAEPKKEFTHKAQNLMRGGNPQPLISALVEKDKPARMQKNPKEEVRKDRNFERARVKTQGRREEYPEEGKGQER